ncbi:hypothetical protein [Buchnera aphidicola]|uniref:hypothetical protein n=1 Tax=Buchnera aphidicola TaxID=9 RepID=UPI0030EF4206
MNIKNNQQNFNNLYKKNFLFYILYGNDNYSIKINIKNILKYFKKYLKIKKIKTIKIKKKIEWINFFYQAKKLDFFEKNKILIVKIYINNIDNKILKKIYKVTINQKKKLILIINVINKYFLLKKIKKKFLKKCKFICCNKINKINMIQSIKKKFIHYGIDNNAIEYIYKITKNNIKTFYNLIELLYLTFPKKKILKKDAKKIIFLENKTYYPWQWIKSLLEGKYKKSIKIINFFKKKNFSSLSLTRYLEKEIFILILMKKKLKSKYKKFFIKNYWKKKMYKRSISNNSLIKYYKIIKIIFSIEKSLKKYEEKNTWFKLKLISSMFL